MDTVQEVTLVRWPVVRDGVRSEPLQVRPGVFVGDDLAQLVSYANQGARERLLDPETAARVAQESYAWAVAQCEALGLPCDFIRVHVTAGVKLPNAYRYAAQCTQLNWDGSRWEAFRCHNKPQGRYGSAWLVIPEIPASGVDRLSFGVQCAALDLTVRKDGLCLVVY